MNLELIADVLERAGHLFCLALAPAFLPPEPAASTHSTLAAIVVASALALVVAAAIRLRARNASREAAVAPVLVVLAVASSIVCAAYFRGPRAPLGRGILFVAVPLWAGLAAAVWAVLVRRFADRQKSQRVFAAVATFGLGFGQLVASASWIGSIDRMWWVTLSRDGNGARALAELTKSSSGARDAAALRDVVDRCLATNPTSCACLSKRSELERKARKLEASLADARLAVTTCPADATSQVALVVALVATGDAEQAEQTARTALAKSPDPELHYALALALEARGRTQDAAASARQAVELGGGRDAELFVAALSIVTGDLDAATKLLEALVTASPNDAEARYNLALVADKKNEYNRAREGYLAALKADPTLANARYNLAMLTLRRGVVEEARHHARKFAEVSPGDPRSADLSRRIEAARPQRP